MPKTKIPYFFMLIYLGELVNKETLLQADLSKGAFSVSLVILKISNFFFLCNGE